MSEIVTTVTGWIVNQGALNAYNEAYKIAGVRDKAMADLESQAAREDWARMVVATAGKSWTTHRAKFSGEVVPR